MTIHEQQAQQNLKDLLQRYNKLSAFDRENMTEASVVRQFIDLLLRDVLGWPAGSRIVAGIQMSHKNDRPEKSEPSD